MKIINKLSMVMVFIFLIIGILLILFGFWQIGIGSFILSAVVLFINQLQNHLLKKTESLEFEISMSSEIFLAGEALGSIITSVNKISRIVLKKLDTTTYLIKFRDKEFTLNLIVDSHIENEESAENTIYNKKSDLLGKEEEKLLINSLLIIYSNEKIPMDKSTFVKSAEQFIELSHEVEKAVKSEPKSRFEVTIWRCVEPDAIYKLRFKKHINNILKSQHTHEIVLKTDNEECKFGKDYTTFRLPLRNLKKVIPHIAEIMW